MPTGIVEQLVHCTVRIACTLANGDTTSGTGFFLNFPLGEELFIPVIVTNKHVIEGAAVGHLMISTRDEKGAPDILNHKEITIPNFEGSWIPHPDTNIDLAVYPIGPLVHDDDANGKTLFYVPLSINNIATKGQKEELSPMEDVVMIGYPNGIWDSKHNLPVIRKGITATHCAKDFRGRSEFLTDIASFPGSSGSPVFLVNIGSYTDNKGTPHLGVSRIYLLGVHYAGAMQTVKGELEFVKTPTSVKALPVSKIPINIGVVIDASRILDFGPVLEKLATAKVGA